MSSAPGTDDPDQPLSALPTEAIEDSDDESEESAAGHADPDADLDLDSEPLEHQLPPETDPAMTFADMKLIRPLFDAVTHAGYVHPTPVQEAVIPAALRGQDVIGQAQTGTGKTAAFLLPFMNRWRPHKLKGPIGLVMTPTRELALQIATEAEKLAPSRHFRTVAGLRRRSAWASNSTASPAAATSSSARPAACSTTFVAAR